MLISTMRHKKNMTWVIVLLNATLLNFSLLQCTQALSFDQKASHDCVHCKISENDSCHSNNFQSDCVISKDVIKTQKVINENNDLPKFTAFAQSYQTTSANIVELFKTNISSEFNYSFLPIYLKNCAFLN